MTSWAAHARVEHAPVAPPRTTRQPKPRQQQSRPPQSRPRRAERHGVATGVVWIVVFGVLLAGVVATNVAVLRENVRLNHLTKTRTELLSGNADLRSQLSAQLSVPHVQNAAHAQGFVPALSGDTSVVVRIPPGK